MMKVRLELAKKLLNPHTGILVVAIDDNELNTTGLLLKEIFPTYKQFCITVAHNPNGNQGKNFGISNEFAYFVLPNGNQLLSMEKWVFARQTVETIANELFVEWNNSRKI